MAYAPDFIFDGYAVGVSGVVNGRPIPSQFICGIPQTGGSTRAELSRFSFDDVVSIGSARAEAHGEKVPNAAAWRSMLHVRLEKCEILGIVRIDEVILSLSSFYPWTGDRPLFDSEQPSFTAIGSTLRNLQITGKSVNVQLDFDSSDQKRRIAGSLVSRIEGVPDWTKENVITIPEFGAVSIADALIEKSDLKLTMLSVALDSSRFRGKLSLCSGTIGGYPVFQETDLVFPDRDIDSPNRLSELNMDEEEIEEVVTELRLWANSHPTPNEPFLFLMGRSLTPLEFFWEVEAKSRIGVAFLTCLAQQSKQWKVPPRQFIARATEASGPE